MSSLAKWVTDGISIEMTKQAKEIADNLAKSGKKSENGKERSVKPMSTNQLRKFFGEIKRIQASGFSADTVDDVIMLKPKLAYAVGRDKCESKIYLFYEEIGPALDKIDCKDITEGEKHFKNFIKIFEAIVAYHKAAGGE